MLRRLSEKLPICLCWGSQGCRPERPFLERLDDFCPILDRQLPDGLINI